MVSTYSFTLLSAQNMELHLGLLLELYARQYKKKKYNQVLAKVYTLANR